MPESSVKKVLQQPKSIGLSKRALSKAPKASSDSDSEPISQQLSASELLSSLTAIGDGQSYVNPQLLRHAPEPPETPGTFAIISLGCTITFWLLPYKMRMLF